MIKQLLLALTILFFTPCSAYYFVTDEMKETAPKNIDFNKLGLMEDKLISGRYSNDKKYYALYNRINMKSGFIVRIFNTKTGKLERSLVRPELKENSSMVSITFNKKDNIIILGGMFGSVLIWNLNDNTLTKSCHDAMGATVKSFSEDDTMIYITTNDHHHKLCSTSSNYVYLTTKNIKYAVLTESNKLLTIYPVQFTPYREDDPFGFSWKEQDLNVANNDVMKENLEIWELNKSKENGFKREAYIDKENKKFMHFEFYPTKTLLEQWDYETKSLVFNQWNSH